MHQKRIHKTSIKRKIGAGILLAAILFTTFPKQISAYADEPGQQVNNEPPADYKVNKATQGEAKDGAYSAFFLEDELQVVQIEIDENNLNYLFRNAADEPYVMTESVTIGDVTLGYCGLKTKGAYTLEHSVLDNEGSNRYSFTVNFGKYIKKKEYGEKQNFFGSSKISFNNFFFDKTMMKEFFALKLMDEMGVPTPEYGLAKLYINGEYYGVYAMVEAMDHSILERHYGLDKDQFSSYLCKPEGTVFDYAAVMSDPAVLWEWDENTKKDVEDMIPTVLDWVEKLNCLSQGLDFGYSPIEANSAEYPELLGQIMDIEEVVKYFAVHSWLCQMDNMFVGQKNFGLYVGTDGRAQLIPWDYDLSYGCYYPSTAETTANYPLDVMYRLEPYMLQEKTEAEISAEVYAGFPLFHVIYQNDDLMEQYHGYMEECSKIALLGGTVESTGKTYDPGFFNSFVERMQEDVIEAATEKTAKNVYYMNHISQPKGAKNGIPNLNRILAYRAVGVLNQIRENNATVCGYGCNLEALGNGMQGSNSASGLLTCVDVVTGIHATAEYKSTGKIAKPPMLTVTRVAENDALYGTVLAAAGYDTDDTAVVYAVKNRVEPVSEYTVTIPLTQELLKAEGELHFYSYTETGAAELVMTADDNLYTGTAESIDYLVAVKKTANGAPMLEAPDAETGEGTGTADLEDSTSDTQEAGAFENGVEQDTAEGLTAFGFVAVGAGGLLVVIGIVFLVRKNRQKK